MTPSPIPGQHGNHQEAGRLAVEAYYLAADPSAFPAQITQEHLRPWRAARLLHQEHLVKSGTGPACETTFTADRPDRRRLRRLGRDAASRTTARPGRRSRPRRAASTPARAGRGAPDAPSDPDKIGCDYLTQVDSRVPFTRGDHDPAAALEGALYPAAGGLPLGTEFYLTTSELRGGPGRALHRHGARSLRARRPVPALGLDGDGLRRRTARQGRVHGDGHRAGRTRTPRARP